MAPPPTYVDVLIVGAGLSGIDAACRLQRHCPGKSWLILESRDAIGGTWDLFRYPGIRSDSDMYTLGFPFRPWRGEKAIAGGAAIRAYIEETARNYGIDRKIRFGTQVTSASWSSAERCWQVETRDGAAYRCGFLFLASGYYDYRGGHRPEWPGEGEFAGRIVHPQAWPEDLDHGGKRIAVIGSGATAVTLAPALAAEAALVTMVQRSPSYIVSMPSRDRLAQALQRLPGGIGDRLNRWKNVLFSIFVFSRARKRPQRVREAILKLAAARLPEGYDLGHFTPAYDPWRQRLCLVPDDDLFDAIKAGKLEIATGEVERFTPGGLRLASGREVAADIVVTATGLVVRLLGGIALHVDGQRVEPGERVVYKGTMLDGVPNLAFVFGYTNASWTLKSDLVARYLCRLLSHMDCKGARVCVPRLPAGGVERRPMIDFSSGYIRRAEGVLPAQGAAGPWRVNQNYLKDLAALRFGRIADGVMEFGAGG